MRYYQVEAAGRTFQFPEREVILAVLADKELGTNVADVLRQKTIEALGTDEVAFRVSVHDLFPADEAPEFIPELLSGLAETNNRAIDQDYDLSDWTAEELALDVERYDYTYEGMAQDILQLHMQKWLDSDPRRVKDPQ